ncbi:MAG: hypothetical protein KGQ59_08265 [Bdellovibrionales bacterium]|nr:hypothetical protein [Bdellovibrionales bacterium]
MSQKKNLLWKSALALLLLNAGAQASDQIIKPLQTVRSSGMGGLKLTTGLYEDNFFGNPARVLANPKWKVTIFDPTIETSRSTITNVSDVASSSGDSLAAIGDTAGNNNHGRIQLSTLSFYIPKGEGRWALAVAPLLTQIQFDVMLRNSYQISPVAIADIGPALTYGRTFFEDERLSIGVTPHVTARMATTSEFTLPDLISGKSLKPGESGGAGAHFDVDFGSTYRLPLQLASFNFDAAFAVNNVLGGKYQNLKTIKIGSANTPPPAQPRSFGLGIAGIREEWGKFRNTVFGLEVQDLGNNKNGSLFRTLHLGGETNWRRLAVRAGLNQGYWTAGVGFDLWVLNFDVCSYGEELSLNTGGYEDRRYALRIALQI